MTIYTSSTFYVALLSYLSFSTHTFGSLLSNHGNKFIIGFGTQHMSYQINGTNRIYIYSKFDIIVNIKAPAISLDKDIKVLSGIPRYISLPGRVRMSSNIGIEKKGIQLTSNKDFAVYGMNLLNKSTDGFLGLPVALLGTNYVVATAIPVIKSFLFVIATENATIVKIKLRISSGGSVTYQNKTYSDGSTIAISLDALEGFQLLSSAHEDLTGSRVTSNKPVSVYSGNDCTYVPVDKKSCDHLVEQILPVKFLGKQFVTMATANRTGGDIYHVIAAYNNTRVTVDNQLVTTLDDGQRYELDSRSSENHVIVTSQPSLVVQYGKGFSVDNSIYDPFMSTIPATSQYTTDYTVFIPKHLSNHDFKSFINIAVRSKELDNIKITQNGKNPVTFDPSECSRISGFYFSVCSKKLISGVYRVYHQSFTEPFALVMYGTWHRESYGFPVGLRINVPGCQPSHMTPEDQIDNDCDGKIDEEIFNNKDDDGDGRVDEDLSTTPPTLTVPPNFTKVICAEWSQFDPKEYGQASGEAHGKCKPLGPVNIKYYDYMRQVDLCNKTIIRTWEITDACRNKVKANQYMFVRFVTKPTLKFPENVTMICRAQNELSTLVTGNVKILDKKCSKYLTTSYQESMFYPCFLTERTLKRIWKVQDECAREVTHKQSIRLLPLENIQDARVFNVSISFSNDITKNETKDHTEARLVQEVDRAILLSPAANSYIGSTVLHFRSGSSRSTAILMVKFKSSSKIMPDNIQSYLHIGIFAGVFRELTNTTDDIMAQDFNECISSDYNDCDLNAACHNNVGSYTCKCLQGFVGNGKKCNELPVIEFVPKHVEAAVGENVTIRCDVKGNPKVTWKTSKGKILDENVALRDVTRLGDGTEIVSVTQQQQDNSLVISNVHVSDSGMYTCMVRNAFGETHKQANLTVRKDRVAVQASVTLIEELYGNDLKDRESLRFRELEKIIITKLNSLFKDIPGYLKVYLIQFKKGSVIALFRVVVKGDQSRDSRQYVENHVGQRLQKQVTTGYIGQLKVSELAKIRERPPAPTHLQSSDIKGTSFKVTWEPPSLHTMYGVSTYTLQYKEFGSHVKTWKTDTVPSSVYTLTKLEPGVSYMVRIKARNEFGASEPSHVLEITTLQEKSTTDWLVLILIPILVLIILIFVIVCLVRVIRKKGKYKPTAMEEVGMVELDSSRGQEPRQSWRPFRSKKFTLEHEDNPDHYTDAGAPSIKKLKRASEMEERLLFEPGEQHAWQEISRDQIALGDVIGEGQFGKVYKGTVTDSSGKEMTCAVKMLKSSATETDLKDLLNELEIMASVGHHNNVIGLIGVCVSGGPLLAVVEYAENGNLLTYLRRHRRQNYDNLTDYIIDISTADRLKFACEISKGMAHLARMKCVHRDLACRNVLLGESLVAKVSDFGLSRDVYTDDVYEKKTGGKLPARWMALESLELGLYSSKSDVWSFGVVLWEIETGGATPFASYTVPEIMEHFKAGRRLGRPTGCNRHLYAMMMRCWNSNPDRRPTFDTLTQELKQLYQDETTYVNVDGKEDTDGNETDQDNPPDTAPQEC